MQLWGHIAKPDTCQSPIYAKLSLCYHFQLNINNNWKHFNKTNLMRSITLVTHIHAFDFIATKMKVLTVDFMCGFLDLMDRLRWRHNGHDSVSNHQPHHCLLNRLFGRRSKKTSKLRVTGLCVGNSPGTGEFPAQMASNAENVSIWWRHHEQLFPFEYRCCIYTEHEVGLYYICLKMAPWKC